VAVAQKNLPARRWGNARSIRNILEAGVENQAVRLRARRGSASEDELLRLTVGDFPFLKDERVPVY
jgi:AAA lid domain